MFTKYIAAGNEYTELVFDMAGTAVKGRSLGRDKTFITQTILVMNDEKNVSLKEIDIKIFYPHKKVDSYLKFLQNILVMKIT
jgi:hypothetical protein